MKKLLYTLSFITVLGFAANAQSKETAKPAEPAKAIDPALKAGQPVELRSTEPSTEPKSRVAITQKGLPASKAKEKEVKDAKATEPKSQPTATEKH